MKPIYRFAFASVIALFVSACSQPTDLPGAELEPQYGTVNNDRADLVTINKNGLLYTLGQSYDTYAGGETRYATSVLTRFDRPGRTLWTRNTGNFCQGNFNDYCGVVSFGLGVDNTGNSYAMTRTYKDDGLDITAATLRKYSPAGTLLWSRNVYQGNGAKSGAIATAPTGETYVAFRYFDYLGDESTTSTLRKYGPSGKQLWEVSLSVANPGGIAVSTSGNVYIAGDDGLAKYRAGEAQIWTRTLDLFSTSVAVSDTNTIYVSGMVRRPADGLFAATATLLKYNAGGTRLWERRGSAEDRIVQVTTDSSGNAYVAGSTESENPGFLGSEDITDYVVRKYTPTGSTAWTSTVALPKTTERGYGVAALSSSELYVVGETDGKVNGKSFGERDAFLMRLDGQGKRVWSR